MVNNLDNFKSFVKDNPSLIKYVKNKSMSWQSFYELYDLYGKDDKIWDEYLSNKEIKEEKSSSSNKSFSDLLNMAKNIDVDKVQNGISSLQKAIGLFSDLVVKKDTPTTSSYTPRPLYKTFED